MKKDLKLFVSCALVALTFSAPQVIYGTEYLPKSGEQETRSGMQIQLKKVAADTLEAVLGSGNDVLLKMSVDLKGLKRPHENEQAEVPVRFFLTDFTSSPTTHGAVDFKVKVDCESIPPTCILPDKPQSFESYEQFTDWLDQGYFMNQVGMTYDFHIDIGQTAPSLAQHLFAVPPDGYHFVGTHVIDNTTIKPDNCVPQISWSSERGNTNATTVTLGGIFRFNSHTYPIDNHQQVFPHPIVKQTVFKRDVTKKFYSYKWLAQCEETGKVTYEEFPNQYRDNWPKAPYETYNLLQKKPGDKEEIKHLACFDGITGQEVNISDGRIFLIDCEAVNKEGSQFLESIVKDDAGKLYTTHYQYSEAEKIKRAAAAAVRRDEEQDKEIARTQQEAEKQARKEAKKQAAEATKKQIESLKVQLAEIMKRVEEAAQKVEDEYRQKLEQEATEIRIAEKAELRKQQAIFAIREAKIDESINHYKVLNSSNLTYGELYNAIMKLYPIYDQRKLLNNVMQNDDKTCKGVLAVAFMEPKGIQWLEKACNYGATSSCELTDRITTSGGEWMGDPINEAQNLASSLKIDIMESMEMYERLYGRPHPRKDEFSKM